MFSFISFDVMKIRVFQSIKYFWEEQEPSDTLCYFTSTSVWYLYQLRKKYHLGIISTRIIKYVDWTKLANVYDNWEFNVYNMVKISVIDFAHIWKQNFKKKKHR